MKYEARNIVKIRDEGRTMRLIRSAALLFSLCSLAFVPLASAQAGHEGHAGGPVPREILERPMPLRQGIGNVHEAVSTSSTEAQAFYDQGLAYEHSFVWIEAARSFHQALRLDPNLAMAYLGLADTYIGMHDVTTARAAFQRAKELERKASQRERMWIAIRESELNYLEISDDPNGYALYRQMLQQDLNADPNDPWVWIQRGLADESRPFSNGKAGSGDKLAFYKTAENLASGKRVWHTN